MKLEHILTPYIKLNSKWFKDLYIKQDTFKLLEENIDEAFSDINYTNVFSQSPKAVEKSKTKQMRSNQAHNLLHGKGDHTQNRKTASEWENLFANIVTKSLISKMYKQLMQLNIENKQTAQ